MENEAKAIAKAVLSDSLQGSTWPIDIGKLHEKETHEGNLLVQTFESEKQVEGRIELLDETAVIFLNLRWAPVTDKRVRFTYAHEVGHYFLHSRLLRSRQALHDAIIQYGEAVLDEVEREANAFAVEVLLPEGRIREVLQKQWLDLALVSSLASEAGTSVQSCAIRCSKLTPLRCCFFFEDPSGVIAWTAPSDGWFRARMNSSHWKGRCAPKGSAASAFKDNYAGKEVARAVWCPNTSLPQSLVESALWLGSYGRLILVVDSEGILV